jgi:hypothetical protein
VTSLADSERHQQTKTVRQLEVHKLADKARLVRFHVRVLFRCALIISFDLLRPVGRRHCGAPSHA